MYTDENLSNVGFTLLKGDLTDRPKSALLVLFAVLENFDRETGRVSLTRDQLARRAGITPQSVSYACTALAELNVLIYKLVRGRREYYLNPRIATCLARGARIEAISDAPQIPKYQPAELSLA